MSQLMAPSKETDIAMQWLAKRILPQIMLSSRETDNTKEKKFLSSIVITNVKLAA